VYIDGSYFDVAAAAPNVIQQLYQQAIFCRVNVDVRALNDQAMAA
jgi:hypothetical protein